MTSFFSLHVYIVFKRILYLTKFENSLFLEYYILIKGDDLMVSHYTILQSVQEIELSTSHEERLYKILEVYLRIFPVFDAYLLRYSPLGFLAEGLIYLDLKKGVHIGEIREDVRNFPIIFAAINDRKAKYCTGHEYLKQVNSKFSITSDVPNSLIVVPIFDGSVVFAYICSSEFQKGMDFDDPLLAAFTFYGKQIGKVINSTNKKIRTQLLSKRELEVMKRIAAGESTKEMAELMNISIFTVNQYVKSAIKKLGAKNRSHAISELYRRDMIS